MGSDNAAANHAIKDMLPVMLRNNNFQLYIDKVYYVFVNTIQKVTYNKNTCYERDLGPGSEVQDDLTLSSVHTLTIDS